MNFQIDSLCEPERMGLPRPKLDALVSELLADLTDRAADRPRRYGFEIEFLPREPLDLGRMKQLYALLPELGFRPADGRFLADSGLFVTFEPGGQIEFGSPPLAATDRKLFRELVANIERVNETILERLGIEYLAMGFLPDRGGVPLCLDAERYINLHRRLGFRGSRGREMMKGTASIHLHSSFVSPEEMLQLHRALCRLGGSEQFGMSAERRHIWENTDPGRCGPLCRGVDMTRGPRHFLRSMTRRFLLAQDLVTDRPAWRTLPLAYDYLAYHMSTIFSDVRINLKAPTVELRTPDARSLPEFEELWWSFVAIMEEVGQEVPTEEPVFCGELGGQVGA